jgi:hypothetical protein
MTQNPLLQTLFHHITKTPAFQFVPPARTKIVFLSEQYMIRLTHNQISVKIPHFSYGISRFFYLLCYNGIDWKSIVRDNGTTFCIYVITRGILKVAKTIKFNLICDGKPVRTMEDLQNNFSIEDVLAYYNNQLLHRWLKVRGYDKELDEVSAITCTKALEIIKELIRIFEVDADEERVERSIYSLAFQQERNGLVSYYNQCGYRATRIDGHRE